MALSLMVACTKPNPRSCADGTCTDPTFPFCDVNGEVDGQNNTCVAVACTAGEFQACRGDLAITCNTAGSDFDLIQCDRGCEDGIGCHLCDPNETACTNGTVASCDANGTVTGSQVCPLGCFEDQPRCRDIDPSNGLGQFVDMVVGPPGLDLTDAVFETSTGNVIVNATTMVSVPSFLVPATGDGPALRVFVVQSLHLKGATAIRSGGPGPGPRVSPPGAAFAVVSLGDIRIEGTVGVEASAGSAVTGCTVGKGAQFTEQDGRHVSSGGGGGGNASAGGLGGAIAGLISPLAPAVNGQVSGTAPLEPLRGGCSGGFVATVNGSFPSGGGAVQLSSATRIAIDGMLDVRGTNVFDFDQDGTTQGGGGAGGSVLLEAPEIALGASARVLATGSNGAQGCDTPFVFCTLGGAGATNTTVATNGGDITAPGPAANGAFSGGGGGGLGRIRINTPDQAFTISSAAVTDGTLTTGVLKTR